MTTKDARCFRTSRGNTNAGSPAATIRLLSGMRMRSGSRRNSSLSMASWRSISCSDRIQYASIGPSMTGGCVGKLCTGSRGSAPNRYCSETAAPADCGDATLQAAAADATHGRCIRQRNDVHEIQAAIARSRELRRFAQQGIRGPIQRLHGDHDGIALLSFHANCLTPRAGARLPGIPRFASGYRLMRSSPHISGRPFATCCGNLLVVTYYRYRLRSSQPPASTSDPAAAIVVSSAPSGGGSNWNAAATPGTPIETIRAVLAMATMDQ